MTTGAKGTPKLGIDCQDCEDWTTILVPRSDSSGDEEVPCPSCQPEHALNLLGGQP